MRKVLASLAILVALCSVSAPASAEVNLRAGVDGAFILPVGNWGDITGMGFGALGKFEYAVMPELTTTFRIGYLFHLKKNDFSTAELPIMFGAKYFFLGDYKVGGLYGALELGLTRLTATASFMGTSISSSSFKFGTTIGAGYEWSGFDFRAQLYGPSLGDFADFMGVLVTVGYTWDFTL
jgi:hypothetical protein